MLTPEGSPRFVRCPTIRQAAHQLEQGLVDLAFVPIENTSAGSMNQVYDLLREKNFQIVGEEIFTLQPCLVGVENVEPSDIQTLLASPLAIEQCSAILENLPQVRIEPCIDTGAALEAVAQRRDPTQVAIASGAAAEAHDLSVIRRGIGNEQEIWTRFVALANEETAFDVRIPCKTSLILTTQHQQGALLRLLELLSAEGLSLTKLESRPQPGHPWAYLFFVDFEGNRHAPNVEAALEKLRTESLFLKILGSYPTKTLPTEARAAVIRPLQMPVATAPVDAAAPVDEQGITTNALQNASDTSSRVGQPPLSTKSPSSRQHRAQDTEIPLGDVLIGGDGFVICAGPSLVHSSADIATLARKLKDAGCHLLAGGTQVGPDATRQTETDADRRQWLNEAGQTSRMPVVADVFSPWGGRGRLPGRGCLSCARPPHEQPCAAPGPWSGAQACPAPPRPQRLCRPMAGVGRLRHGPRQQPSHLLDAGIQTGPFGAAPVLDIAGLAALRARSHLPLMVDLTDACPPGSILATARALRAAGVQGLYLTTEATPPSPSPGAPPSAAIDVPTLERLLSGLA